MTALTHRDLDTWITGNWGEDSIPENNEPEEQTKMNQYIGFESFENTAAFNTGTNDDGEHGCSIVVGGDGEHASIWLDLDQTKALASFLLDYIADFEG